MFQLWFSAMLMAGLAQIPEDVKLFVERRLQCEHFAGEDQYDASRAAEINAAWRRLQCDRIDADEIRIRNKYTRNPIVLKALNADPI